MDGLNHFDFIPRVCYEAINQSINQSTIITITIPKHAGGLDGWIREKCMAPPGSTLSSKAHKCSNRALGYLVPGSPTCTTTL